MADEQDIDRNEAATPYKLQKAQEKGQVAKSADVISTMVWTVAVVFLMWHGWETVRNQFRFDQTLLLQAARLDAHGAALWPLIAHMLQSTLSLLIPFFVVRDGRWVRGVQDE